MHQVLYKRKNLMTDRFSNFSPKSLDQSPEEQSRVSSTNKKKDWTRQLWEVSDESAQILPLSSHELPKKTESPNKKRLSTFEKIVSSTEDIIDTRNMSSPEDVQSVDKKVQKLSKALSNCLLQLAGQLSKSENHWLEVQLRRYNDQLIEICKDYEEWSKNHYENIKEDKDLLKANNSLSTNIFSIASYSVREYNPYSQTDPMVLGKYLIDTKKDVQYSRKAVNSTRNLIDKLKENNIKTKLANKKYSEFSRHLQECKSRLNTVDSRITINDSNHLLFQTLIQHSKSLMRENIRRIENNLKYLQDTHKMGQ